jgi:hypothetical protein
MQMRTAAALTVFAVVFSILTVSSYTQKSATIDEPTHLAAGYTMLRLHDYREDLQHPPFLRMWAALPLLAMHDIRLNTNTDSWEHPYRAKFARKFLYEDNDADRLLYRARFMIVLLGILLGGLIFFWMRQLYGLWPAGVVLALYTLEPNILAHSSLATTDLGVTCFVLGTIYFLWRTVQAITFWNLFGLTTFFVLAQISKFSAILLGPMVLLLLLAQILRRTPFSWRIGRPCEIASPWGKALVALAMILLLTIISWFAVWAAYGFRYSPRPAGTQLSAEAVPTGNDNRDIKSLLAIWDARERQYEVSPATKEHNPKLATVISWMDHWHFLPNAFTEGFLQGHATQAARAFLAGHWRKGGWWYYFPVAVLIKTPITLLVLVVTGVCLCAVRRKAFLSNELFLLVPIIVYLGVAMASEINIGLRHILPIYPFALVLAGKTIHELSLRARPIVLIVPVGLAALELATVYPHYIAFFNQFVGGSRNGHWYLVDSNLDWGQDLKPLKKWMDKNRVEHINLRYFGAANPVYYGINCTTLPANPDSLKSVKPRLPGFVAVSVHSLQGSSTEHPEQFPYRPLLKEKPVAIIGYSIYVYQVDHPWWPAN